MLAAAEENLTDLFSDNQRAIALARNLVSHARAKHIDVPHHFVREAIHDKIIWVQYIPTPEMTADSLIKALGREKQEKCTARMGMTSQDVNGSPSNCIVLGDNLEKAWSIFVLEMDSGSPFTLEGISAIACHITDIRLENISCFGSGIFIS